MKRLTLLVGLNIVSITFCLSQRPAQDTSQHLFFNFHFQLTTVTQFKPALHAPYTGANSLTGKEEKATTLTSTIFWGTRLWKGSEVYINPEIAGGAGISSAKGIAGFTNGEAFRVGDPAPKLYVARVFLRQTFNLNNDYENIEDDVNQVGRTRASKYISITLGKFGIADFYDNNEFSHDPRTQFLNWSLMSMGAWDYPANTRGYTWGSSIEYGSAGGTIRIASTLVPKEANGNDMDLHFFKAQSTVIEFEKPVAIRRRPGTIRLLAFYTTAHMGNYAQAVSEEPSTPDIVSTRSYGRTKYGFGVNAEQHIGDHLGFFSRLSWNDGKNETWAFTEIDRSFSAGIHADGKWWQRKNDEAGVATAVNGLSPQHKNYLASGGYGFIVGDGMLNYGQEWIIEAFYQANMFSDKFWITTDYQFVVNPAYNKDRGPAHVFSIRGHIQF